MKKFLFSLFLSLSVLLPSMSLGQGKLNISGDKLCAPLDRYPQNYSNLTFIDARLATWLCGFLLRPGNLWEYTQLHTTGCSIDFWLGDYGGNTTKSDRLRMWHDARDEMDDYYDKVMPLQSVSISGNCQANNPFFRISTCSLPNDLDLSLANHCN